MKLKKKNEDSKKDKIEFFENEINLHNMNLHSIEKEWNAKKKELREKYGYDTSVFNSHYVEEEYKYNDKIEQENDRHKETLTKNYDDLTDAFTDDAQKQAGVWMAMLGDVELYGGKINKNFYSRTSREVRRCA